MESSSTSVTKVIRVLIADDHPVVREGLVTILKSEKDIEVGQVLYISENTVKNHVKSILTNLSGFVNHAGWLP